MAGGSLLVPELRPTFVAARSQRRHAASRGGRSNRESRLDIHQKNHAAKAKTAMTGKHTVCHTRRTVRVTDVSFYERMEQHQPCTERIGFGAGRKSYRKDECSIALTNSHRLDYCCGSSGKDEGRCDVLGVSGKGFVSGLRR